MPCRTCPLRKGRDNDFLSMTTLLLALLHLVEVMSLVLLAMISSIEHHCKCDVLFCLQKRLLAAAHAVFFTLFVVSSVGYMALNTYMFDFSGRRRSFTQVRMCISLYFDEAKAQGELSYQHKALSLLASVLCILLAAYLYYRHNAYCEPGGRYSNGLTKQRFYLQCTRYLHWLNTSLWHATYGIIIR